LKENENRVPGSSDLSRRSPRLHAVAAGDGQRSAGETHRFDLALERKTIVWARLERRKSTAGRLDPIIEAVPRVYG
jgi:hypothetical protein